MAEALTAPQSKALAPSNVKLTGRQKAAVLLVSLGAQRASAVFKHLRESEIEQLSLEMSQMDSVKPEAVDAVYTEASEELMAAEYIAQGGLDFAREVLEGSVGEDRAKDIIGRLSAIIEVRPFEFLRRTPAEEIRMLLFVFEDIVKLDDRSVQLVLKDVDQKDLAMALRGVSDEVKQKILGNMSQRGSEMLIEEMEYQPPQRRSVVEEAQGRIVATIRHLEDAGAIVIARGSEDAEEAEELV